MTHHRDAGIEDELHGGQDLNTTLQLQCITAGLLHDTDSIADGILRVHLIRSERHVTDHQCALHTTNDAASMIDHLVERDGERCDVTCHHVRSTVAHKDHVDAGAIHDLSH